MVGEAALSNKAKGVFIWISLNSSKICFIFLRTVLTSVLGLWNGCFVPLPTPFFNNGVVLMYRKFSDLIVLSWRKSSSFYKNKSRSYCTSRILIFLCLCIWHSSSWERFFLSPQQANGITSAPAFLTHLCLYEYNLKRYRSKIFFILWEQSCHVSTEA